MANNERAVREEFNRLFESNKTIENVYKRVRNGTATYKEAHEFAKELGRILAKVFGNQIDPNNIDDTALYIIDNMIRQNVKLTNAVCEGVQDTINNLSGVGIKPVAPNPSQTSKRIERTVKGIAQAPVEKAGNVLQSNAEMIGLAMVDEWVRTNADFQARAGLDPVIVRVWDGVTGTHDTNHTDKCREWAGVFNYRDCPPSTFIRHKGCGCTVVYYPSKDAKGRITALEKGTKDTNKVLWNTGNEMSQSRDAVLRRRRKLYGKDKAREILNNEWQGGRNGQAERHY